MRDGTLLFAHLGLRQVEVPFEVLGESRLATTLYCIIVPAGVDGGVRGCGRRPAKATRASAPQSSAAEVGREEEEEEALVLFDASAAAKRFLVETFVLRPSHLCVRVCHESGVSVWRMSRGVSVRGREGREGACRCLAAWLCMLGACALLQLLLLLTDLWPSASLAVIRFFGSTISRLRTKSFASAEMGSQ